MEQASEPAWQQRRGVAIAHGASAAEDALIEAVLAAARVDPASGFPEAPVRVVVPSRSLREHLSSRLVARAGGALAGLVVQTLHAVATTILESARSRGLDGRVRSSSLFGVLVRQVARREPALRAALGELRDGYATVESAVSDLFDAGFEPAHTDAVLEQLADSAAVGASANRGLDARERACALVRVAREVAEMCEATGIAHHSAEVVRARERLEEDPARYLPTTQIFVFGFADVTGVQTDLIEALVRRCGARVLIDVPIGASRRSEFEPERDGSGSVAVYAQRFAERMRSASNGAIEIAETTRTASLRPPAVSVLHAPGRSAEMRAVAVRVRRLLDSGARPEGIGVVARNLDGYREALRTHFSRLAIPFSGVGERVGATPTTRRHAALLALLREAEAAPTDRWIDALGGLGRSRELTLQQRADLRTTLHRTGIVRLGQLLEWSGVAPPGVSADRIATAVAAGRSLLNRILTWPQRASLQSHLHALRALTVRELRWRDAALDALEREVFEDLAREPEEFELERDDFLRLVDRRLATSRGEPIGGQGGGVAALSAMEARARTFEHLFVFGLSRDVFPRPISEDPLLSDALRRRLRVVLPDMPVKREGVDEDRYLFAQLLSSSPEIVLSCPIADENGRPISVSPLLEWMSGIEPTVVSGLFSSDPLPSDQADPSSLPPGSPGNLRPAHEHALVAGLYGTREQFDRAFRIAVAETGGESRRRLGSTPSLAASRVAVLAELHDHAPRAPARLGPHFGFVGPSTDKADPRGAPLFITAMERIAACPWQAFVNRLMRVEPVRDARADLPAADPQIVGALVHAVLQDLATEAMTRAGADVEDHDLLRLSEQPRVVVEPPPSAEWERLLRVRAERLAVERGILVPGFSRVLAAAARAHLATAGRTFATGGSEDAAGVVGVEVTGCVQTGRGAREVRFRADRVDASVDGKLTLIDYKTGRSSANQKSDAARREALRKRMARGELLQAGAYALAAQQASGQTGRGEYLHLDPQTPDHARSLEVRSDDSDLIESFERSVAAVFEVVDRGSFFPRLVEADTGVEPRRCSSCEVKEACVRGDTGTRRRLERWVSQAPVVSDEEAALLKLWKIGEGDS